MREKTLNLKKKSNEIRQLTMECIHSIGVGHVGGCLSLAEVLASLYFGGLMNIDPKNPKLEGRDRLVVSK
ncbi:MAG: transketolase, partial [Lawsonibacter sp.]